jgi:hypothetical protein
VFVTKVETVDEYEGHDSCRNKIKHQKCFVQINEESCEFRITRDMLKRGVCAYCMVL